jgi:hypothetical protein
MNFASYTAFRTAVLTMIDGDASDQGAINTATLDLIIGMGEQAVYYGMSGPQGEELPPLRCADMESPLSITATGNVAPLPADCMEVIRVQQTAQNPMDYVPEEGVLRLLNASAGSGAARQFTQQGRNLLFFPTIADGSTIQGRYYAKAPDISLGTLSAAFNRYPDVWLYAALAESAPFLGEDDRIALWKSQYKGRLLAANRLERNRIPSGSRLSVRTR